MKLEVAQLRQQVQSGTGPRLIDVRTPGEFETAHIPGSYNVPLDLLREHRDELRAHLDEQVVLICRSGRRAVEAEQALAAAGLPNLRLLDGGIDAWQAAGGEVRHGEPRWDLERQVRLVAGAIVLTAVLVGLLVPPVTWLAGLVGAGLVVAALTNTCVMGTLLAKLPYNRGPRATFEAVVAALASERG
ncbi:Rhodanese-related sulfurtransferase [Lentzea albidocapillata subsp. violacea]|uniref:Rhodanese-related sulfurtransferase n=1 Tax=Lentzea albidocapillata subsp. violacea TaxID=128104 RepID=A0A1G9YAQ5_9PSEU|nr:rhodanese-like domain-containing protein [Lentzea albidocapillata]SDN06214.1 Rhodanese-related sulfurtransferase [Lentzea albidocapillata subsp. violacea]